MESIYLTEKWTAMDFGERLDFLFERQDEINKSLKKPFRL